MKLEEQVRVYFREFEDTLPEISADRVADKVYGSGRVWVEWPDEGPRRVWGWPRPLVALAAAVVVLVAVGGLLVGVRLLGGEDQTHADVMEVFFSSESGMVRYPAPAECWVCSAAVGQDGTLWQVGDGEVLRFDGKTWTLYGPQDGLLGGTIVAVEVAADGTVWVVHVNGVSRLDEHGWTTHTTSRRWFAETAAAPDGSLWATGYRQLFHYTDTVSYQAYPLDLPYESSVGLAVGPDGILWVNDSDRGFQSFDGDTWTTYQMPAGLLPDGAWPFGSFAVAPDGSVWITLAGFNPDLPGAYGQGMGVVRFDGTTWTYFGEDDGLHQGLPTEIAISPDGTVWAASPGVWAAPGGDFTNEELIEVVGGGLFRYTGDRWEKVLDQGGDNLAVGPDGEVWVPGSGQWIRYVP